MENHKQKRNRASDDQMQIMLEFMEKHSLFARGQIPKLGPRGNETYNKMWVQLTQQLNQYGPTVKDTKGWMTVWRNTRLSVKRKKAEYSTQRNRTGNIRMTTQPLTEFETRVSAIFGSYGNGLPIISEVGVKKEALDRIETLENERDKKKRDRPSKDQLNILVDFVETHLTLVPGLLTCENTQLWTEITSILNSIPGGAIREMKAWITCWKDLRVRVEQKKTLLLNAKDDENIAPLSEYNMKVLNITKKYDALEKSNFPPRICKSAEDACSQCRSRSPLQRSKPSTSTCTPGPLREKFIVQEEGNDLQAKERNSGFAYLLNMKTPSRKATAPMIDLTKEPAQQSNIRGKSVKNENSVIFKMVNDQSRLINDCVTMLAECLRAQNNILENGIEKICETISSSLVLKREVKIEPQPASENTIGFEHKIENKEDTDENLNENEELPEEYEKMEEDIEVHLPNSQVTEIVYEYKDY